VRNYIDRSLQESIFTKKSTVADSRDKILKAVAMIVDTFNAGGKLLVCGNGGSAADSFHICGEFTNRLLKERKPLPAIPLTGDVSSITAISNDYSYDEIFSKQVKALGKKGDLLWAITTSGNSKNVLMAAREASEKGMKVLSFSGGEGGKIVKMSDLSIVVSHSSVCPRVQETHSFLYHVIIELVEETLFGDKNDE